MTMFYNRQAVVEARQYVGEVFEDGIVNLTQDAVVVEIEGANVLLAPQEMVVPTGMTDSVLPKILILRPGEWLVTDPVGHRFRFQDATLHEKYAEIVEINGDSSDGYHTFNELYRHRHALFAAVLSVYADWGFRTWQTADGRITPGWFIAGLNTPYGQLSYHYPAEWWDRLAFLRVVEANSGYDGHTSEDVLFRLGKLAAMRWGVTVGEE